MAGVRTITFDDRDTNTLRYQGGWFNQGTWDATNVGQSGTLSTSNDPSASVTFDFPQPAVAFHYYGIRRSNGGTYGICVDCDPNNQNFETIDAVNFTDDGKNPPVLLFSRQFSPPAVHEIILRNEPDPRFANDNSQITVDRFEIEVVDNAPAPPPPPPPPPSPPKTTTTQTPSTPPTSTPSLGSSTATIQTVSRSSTATIQTVSRLSSASIQTVPGSSTLTTQVSVSGSSSSPTTQVASMPSTSTQIASTSPTVTTAAVTFGDGPKAPAGKVVGGVLGGLGLLLVILTFWLLCWRRRRNQKIQEPYTPVASDLSSTTQQSQAVPTGRMSEAQTRTSSPVYTRKLRNGHRSGPSPQDRISAATSSGRVIEREVDAGPLGGSGYVETLPPDYEQAVGRSRTTTTSDDSSEPHLERYGAKSRAL